MFKEGQIIKINGEKGIVCFVAEYKNKTYLNISFGEDKYTFKFYRVEIEGKETVFYEEKDQRTIEKLTTKFVSDCIINN